MFISMFRGLVLIKQRVLGCLISNFQFDYQMPNITSILRSEISRIARREIKSESDALKKSNSRYRADIAQLKRQVAALEQQVRKLEKVSTKASSPSPKESPSPDGLATRFSASGLKKLRERLELSAPTLATILGVSSQSVYNWEQGTSRPGKDMVTNISILKKMGKREVQQRLAAMKSAS
jgi:DNA-binding transcriptional regulator YiaG